MPGRFLRKPLAFIVEGFLRSGVGSLRLTSTVRPGLTTTTSAEKWLTANEGDGFHGLHRFSRSRTRIAWAI